MMDSSIVALCADAASLRYPGALGLPEENLAAQEWLRLFSSGEDARRFLRTDESVGEVWVASCDDIEPINLAATLKGDRTERRVCLLAFEGTGSLKSRASQAGIDATLTRQAFAERYAQYKRRNAVGRGVRDDSRSAPSDSGTCGAATAGYDPYGLHEQRGSCGTWGAGATGGAREVSGPHDAQSRRDPHAPYDRRGGQDLSGTQNMREARGAWNPQGRPGAASGAAPAHPAPAERFVPDARPAGRTYQAAPTARQVNSSTSSRASAAQVERPAFLLPVVSGSGGAGKSAVSVLTAVLAQSMGLKTLLIDLDLQFGDAAALLGIRDALAIDEALAQPGRTARLRTEGPLPAVLAAPKRLEEAEALQERTFALVDEAAGPFDVVVANTGASWGEQHAMLLERSSKALFLVDQRASSLRACRHALDLCARCGIATGPFQFLANRCSKHASYTSIDVSCALGGMPVAELQDGGREVEELLAAGQPIDLVQSRNAFCTSLERLLVDVLPGCSDAHVGDDVGEERRGLGLFRRGKKPRKRRELP